MYIVLDTNAFFSDVHMTGHWLSTIVDGAEKGDFSLIVPETVVRELVRQFPERMREAAETANRALTKANKEFRRLGVAGGDLLEIDGAMVASYEANLRRRLTGKGRRVEPDPNRMSLVVDWAVQKRKPFKESGEGAPDATIWLTVLQLAEIDDVVLLSTNGEDFGRGGRSDELHPQLAEDLNARRLPPGRVRLVTSVGTLVEQIVEPLAETDARAARLFAEPPFSGRMREAVQATLLWGPLPEAGLRLGVALEEDPQIAGVELDRFEVVSARETDDGELLMEVSALADVDLEMTIYRADAYIADAESPIVIGHDDFSERYVLAYASVPVWLTLQISSDLEACEIDVDLIDATRLSDEEALQRRLDAGAADDLVRGVNELLANAGFPLDAYLPVEQLQSDTSRVVVGRLPDRDAVSVISVDNAADVVAATLRLDATGAVTWFVRAPSREDVAAFPALADGPEGHEWLYKHEPAEPLVLLVTAELSPHGTWSAIEIQEVVLAHTELARREVSPDAGSQTPPESRVSAPEPSDGVP